MSRHARLLIFSFFLLFPLTAFSEVLPSEINKNSIAFVFGDVHCAFDEVTSKPEKQVLLRIIQRAPEETVTL